MESDLYGASYGRFTVGIGRWIDGNLIQLENTNNNIQTVRHDMNNVNINK